MGLHETKNSLCGEGKIKQKTTYGKRKTQARHPNSG